MAITDRVIPPTIERREVFQPVAAPVDMYVRPETPARSRLYDLAEGLSNLSSGLQKFMGERKAKDDKRQAIIGRAQFLKDNSVGYAEAVRTGKIPSYASEEFVSGYKEAEGQAVGMRLASKWSLEYGQWEGRNSTDPAAFDGFLSDFLARNLETDDPDVLAGAMPYITQLYSNAYATATQEAADNTYNQGLDSYGAAGNAAIDTADATGLAQGEIPYEQTWEVLMQQRAQALSTGIKDDDYDSRLVTNVISKATELNDPGWLELLETQKVPGTDYTYGDLTEVAPKIAAAKEAIASNLTTAANAAYTRQTREEEALKDQMTTEALANMVEDPNWKPDPEWERQMKKVLPEWDLKKVEWRNAIINGSEEDVEAVTDLYNRIRNGEDANKVITYGLDAGIITKPGTITGLTTYGKSVTGENASFRDNTLFKSNLGALKSAATPTSDDTFFNPDKASPEASQVMLDYERAMAQWAAANPELAKNPVAVSEEADRVFTILQKSIVSTDAGPDYQPPLEELGLTPTAGQQAQLTEEQAAAAAAEEAAAFQDSPEGQLTGDGVGNANLLDPSTTLDMLNENERRMLEEAAQSMGDDPEALFEILKKNAAEAIKSQEGVSQDPLGDLINNVLGGGQPEAEPQAPAMEPFPLSDEAPGPVSAVTEASDGRIQVADLTGGAQYIREGGTRGWRNMNPGNLRASEATTQLGAIGQDDDGFAVFPDENTGRAAQRAILFERNNGYADLTVSEAIGRYSPKEENDTATYLNFVTKQAGIDPGADLRSLPRAKQDALLKAMNEFEGYEEGSVTVTQAVTAVASVPEYEASIRATLDQAVATPTDTLAIAEAFLGADERDPKAAKALSSFFKKAGLSADPSTTAWCAAFANAVLAEGGYEGSGKLTARSLLDIGTAVDKPQAGDLVVFSRGDPDGWQGHVGFVVGVNKDGTIKVLGGNQSTQDSGARGVQVTIDTYSTDRVLGYRRPTKKKVRTMVADAALAA